MALRLTGALLLALAGCLAIAGLNGFSAHSSTKFFVPAAATQAYAETHGANTNGAPVYAVSPVQLPHTFSGFVAPQQASGQSSPVVGLLWGLAGAAVGLRVAAAAVTPTSMSSTRRGSSRRGEATMQLFGPKKTPEEKLEELGYWPGEWVCADCGFIYEPGTTPPFEELRRGWKCPQCAGPRRRFVKKAGGVIAAVDDSPLLIGTAVALVLLAGLTYLGLTI